MSQPTNDTATLVIGGAAGGAFLAAILWNTAALWPISIVAAVAIIVRPALNWNRERIRLQREKITLQQQAVEALQATQTQLIALSEYQEETKYLPEATAPQVSLPQVLEQISQTLEKL